MRNIILIMLVGMLVLPGCSGGGAVDAKEEKKKESEAVKEKNTEEQAKFEYQNQLKDELWKLDGRLKQIIFSDQENMIIIAGLMYLELDMPTIKIELLEPPDSLKDKHEQLVTHLKSSKAVLTPAMQTDQNTAYENINASNQQFARAMEVMSEILKQ